MMNVKAIWFNVDWVHAMAIDDVLLLVFGRLLEVGTHLITEPSLTKKAKVVGLTVTMSAPTSSSWPVLCSVLTDPMNWSD